MPGLRWTSARLGVGLVATATVIAAGICLFLVNILLFQSVTSFTDVIGDRSHVKLRDTPTLVARSTSTSDGPRINVVISISDVDSSSGQIRGHVSVRMPLSDELKVKVGCPGTDAIVSADEIVEVSPEAANGAIIVVVEDSELADDPIQIPLESLREDDGELRRDVPIALGAYQDGRFPRDRYASSANVDVRLSKGLWFERRGVLGCVGGSIPAPDAPFVISAQNKSGRLAIDSLDLSAQELIFPPVDFELRRSSSEVWFVYAMLTMPALLVLVVLGTSLARRKRPRPEGGHQGEAGPQSLAAVELAIGVLSLIALRSVLVPPEVRGVTIVDWVLGLELAVFVLIASSFALASLRGSGDGRDNTQA